MNEKPLTQEEEYKQAFVQKYINTLRKKYETAMNDIISLEVNFSFEKEKVDKLLKTVAEMNDHISQLQTDIENLKQTISKKKKE